MAQLKPHVAVDRDTPSTAKAFGWRLVPRVAAVLAVGSAIKLWPAANSGYGVAFWLWACGVVAYALSFQRARPTLPPPRAAVQGALLGILVVAAVLRFVLIKRYPAEIHIDEILPGLEALNIIQGKTPNVFSGVGWFSTPYLAFAFPALAMRITHYEPFVAARLTSGVMGLAGIVCLFLLARRLFGDRVALIASFLMAVSFWHIHDSRTAFSYIQASFCTALVLYLLVRARQDRSRGTFAIAGIALGLALECYFPVRILLLVCPLFWLAGVTRDPVRMTVADGATFGLGALLVLAPLLVVVPWRVLIGHSQQVLLTDPSTLYELERHYHVAGLPAVFLRNLRETAGIFIEWANPCVWHQTPAALLDMGTLCALIIGVCIASDIDALLLVVWVAITLVLGVAFTSAPRAAYRLAAAMPALFILAAYGVEGVLRTADAAPRWYRRTVRPALLAGAALWVLTTNYELFFIRYANGGARDNSDARARRLLSAHCDGREFYFVGGWSDPSGGVGAEPQALDLFCPQHKPVTVEQIKAGIDTTHAATFLVREETSPAVDLMRRCYPSAQIIARRSRDGRFLFTSVDVAAGDLVGNRSCAEEG